MNEAVTKMALSVIARVARRAAENGQKFAKGMRMALEPLRMSTEGEPSDPKDFVILEGRRAKSAGKSEGDNPYGADDALKMLLWSIGYGDVGEGVQMSLRVRYMSIRAPKGGVSIGGKEYKGGQFIPGTELSGATEKELNTLNKEANLPKIDKDSKAFKHLSDLSRLVGTGKRFEAKNRLESAREDLKAAGLSDGDVEYIVNKLGGGTVSGKDAPEGVEKREGEKEGGDTQASEEEKSSKNSPSGVEKGIYRDTIKDEAADVQPPATPSEENKMEAAKKVKLTNQAGQVVEHEVGEYASERFDDLDRMFNIVPDPINHDLPKITAKSQDQEDYADNVRRTALIELGRELGKVTSDKLSQHPELIEPTMKAALEMLNKETDARWILDNKNSLNSRRFILKWAAENKPELLKGTILERRV